MSVAVFDSAHMQYVFYNDPLVARQIYEYDSASDGPECEVITRILARHPRYVPGVEKRANFISLLATGELWHKEAV